ncbi:nuclear transport factor 2 family protein [Hoyosella rhizosphaerae]|uniref:Epoxide hydrolase EphG n=1 Tax=Hoyosella rhizosphaerae TaxID=1755582 RepID=A0A916TZG6_9ACTN|nr:limonene-1,2-epoxide hydrolase family protein [Hoyosella rhizosphaerae]MBN4927168.1 nuclear transport factor 2 family protein [Hoyosella rhizosphaerae]GGC53478.1 epoxide hydrolase EphG [Hoyosella rhizosphaerae]
MAYEGEDSSSGVVVAFLAALRDEQFDQALSYVTEDLVWHNVSLPKVRGKRNVSRAFALMKKLNMRFDVQFHHIGTGTDAVLTERTDALSLGRFRIEFWVCGTFEFRDGKISVWRDRFDYANFTFAIIRGLVGIVLPRRQPFALFAPGLAALSGKSQARRT